MIDLTPVYLGGTHALSTEPVVGTPRAPRDDVYTPGSEELTEGEIRVSILGSGLPWVTKAQASGSVLMEVGNAERDIFIFDLGAGSLANFASLKLPVTSLKHVFLTHLHADHVSDFLALMGSFVKAGRIDPLEVWGGASDVPEWGVAAFVEAIDRALAWDHNTLKGHVPTGGFAATTTELPFDRSEICYQRNGVTITSFPVIHALNGAVGFRLDYAGRSVVFSGDTLPSRTVVKAAQGCDLLIHEAALPAEPFSELTGMPIEKSRFVVNEGHTPAGAAGVVFDMVRPRMAAMWHCHVIDGYIAPIFEEAGKAYAGATVLTQDRTVFNVTEDAVQVRQAAPVWQAQPILGPSATTPTLEEPNPAPSWFADALIDWQHR